MPAEHPRKIQKEFALSNDQIEIWQGYNQIPLTHSATKLTVEGPHLALVSPTGEETSLPLKVPTFVDLQVLHRPINPSQRVSRVDLTQEKWITHRPTENAHTYSITEQPETRYQTTLRGIPNELRSTVTDSKGEEIAYVTLGLWLHKAGIRKLETKNPTGECIIITHYSTRSILMIWESLHDQEYTIYYVDQNNEMKSDTR